MACTRLLAVGTGQSMKYCRAIAVMFLCTVPNCRWLCIRMIWLRNTDEWCLLTLQERQIVRGNPGDPVRVIMQFLATVR